ncbi:EscC/YscC/HrcC family type III secretion system outer membrane ring protein [Vibrio sp. CAIM 722]|uniref:Type 3 secretion system secretin n=1 Tax=Vibrio eleionomae TaxID=2653505 RepID=A0A7X4LLW4_9VIBR|nr:type III secretion system outer membrane ring subunit SctC [Vibrio eleionomae]MZI94365.1 EscC/YscC/HrcC family type III secretion system outer membrane ring protein [Vibrio eleionomae]
MKKNMHWLPILLTLLILCISSAAHGATPKKWQKTAYAFEANHTSLLDALHQFSKTFGVKLNMGNVRGELNGKLRANSATDYLNRLALEYQFLWFVYNGTLYVSPLKDQTSTTIEVSDDAVSDLKNALTQVGLLDKRFGWGELPDEGIVMVSGPTHYVELVKKFSKKKKTKAEKMEVMVFPLKYALVGDRNIKFRDKKITIPGIASMLRDLLESKKEAPLGMNTNNMTLGSSLQALGNLQSLAQQRMQNKMMNNSMSQTMVNQELNNQKSADSKISADTRNNAVLIRDDIDKHDMYQSLINKLDRPRNVIEIDAIILDIDKNRLDQLGIDWQVGAGSTEAEFNASGVSPFLSTGSAATVMIQDFGHFFAQIRALESEGEASLIANPSILTIENQPAVIDFNDTAYISSIGERVANVSPVTAGTSLEVVPRMIESPSAKLIQLSLDIEDGKIEYNDNSTTPTVNRGTISTQAIMQSQRSLVVGGFKVESNSQSNSKVPLLGDIPGLGKLFSYKDNDQSKRERLFIITPRLVGNELNPHQFEPERNNDEEQKALDKDRAKKLGITRTQVAKALTQLNNLYLPDGFTLEKSIPYTLEHYCERTDGVTFDRTNRQWYGGKKFALLVGTVTNHTTHSVRFDEATCTHRDTLAVAVRPSTLMAPGQSAEVMTAVIPPDNKKTTRTSLLDVQH